MAGVYGSDEGQCGKPIGLLFQSGSAGADVPAGFWQLGLADDGTHLGLVLVDDGQSQGTLGEIGLGGGGGDPLGEHRLATSPGDVFATDLD